MIGFLDEVFSFFSSGSFFLVLVFGRRQCNYSGLSIVGECMLLDLYIHREHVAFLFEKLFLYKSKLCNLALLN